MKEETNEWRNECRNGWRNEWSKQIIYENVNQINCYEGDDMMWYE